MAFAKVPDALRRDAEVSVSISRAALDKVILPAMHQLPAEVHDFEVLSLYQRFVAITGVLPWKRRLEKVRAELSDPFRRRFHGDAFFLEEAMLEVQMELLRHRRFPAVRTTALYQLVALVSNAVSVFERLSEPAKRRMAGRITDRLKSDYGLAPFHFEMSVVGALASRGHKIGFSDLEAPGGFDFLVDSQGLLLEIECKSLERDIGRRIKRQAALAQYLRVRKQIETSILPKLTGGLLLKAVVPDTLSKEHKQQDALAAAILRALATGVSTTDEKFGARVELRHFDIHDSPFGKGSNEVGAEKGLPDFVSRMTGEANKEALSFVRPGRCAVVLVLATDRPDANVNDWLKEPRSSAGRQFTRQRPGILCVQFDGLEDASIRDLAMQEVSGFSVSATRILDNEDRSHLVSVVYFGQLRQEQLTRMGASISVPGTTYIVHNPNHPQRGDRRISLFSGTALVSSSGY